MLTAEILERLRAKKPENDGVDVEILWNVHAYELDALEAAVKAMASIENDKLSN